MFKRTELDYKQLEQFLTQKKSQPSANKLPLEKVAHRIHKVAFDVYTVENDPYDGLWKLEAAEDGKEYLVRMDGEVEVETKTGGWSATSNENGTSITLAYKGVPVQRLAGKIFGFSKSDVGVFKKALLEKVASDQGFVAKILDMQSDEKRSELVKTFPELAVVK